MMSATLPISGLKGGSGLKLPVNWACSPMRCASNCPGPWIASPPTWDWRRSIMRDLTEALSPTLVRVRADQQSRWQRGERVLVEEYLAREPDLAENEELLLDLVYSEVLLREEHGERPELDEYLRRFPHLDESLQRQWLVHKALSALDATGKSANGHSGSTTRLDDTGSSTPSPRLDEPALCEIG